MKAAFVLFALVSVAAPVFGQNRTHSVIIRGMGARAWLGAGVGELTAERAKTLKLTSTQGVEVFLVSDDSPSSKAGLKVGDVVLEVNGDKVQDTEQFARSIAESSPGAKVTLGVWRNGAKQNITAVLEQRPTPIFTQLPPMLPEPSFQVIPADSPRAGFEGETLTPQLAEFFGVREGVLVRTVLQKSPAEKAGLKAGDIITKVGGTPVSSSREISGLLRAGHKTATFTVMRNHKEMVLNVEIAALRITPDEDATIAAEWQSIKPRF